MEFPHFSWMFSSLQRFNLVSPETPESSASWMARVHDRNQEAAVKSINGSTLVWNHESEIAPLYAKAAKVYQLQVAMVEVQTCWF